MIPVATTTVTILRISDDTSDNVAGPGETNPAYIGFDEGGGNRPRQGTEARSPQSVARGVRAVFSSPGFRDPTNEAPLVSMRLRTDPTDLRDGDVVVDERTGVRWDVQWAQGSAVAPFAHSLAQVWR